MSHLRLVPPPEDNATETARGNAEDTARGNAEEYAVGAKAYPKHGAAKSPGWPGYASGPGPAQELDPDADPVEVARSIVLRQLTGSAKTRAQLERTLAERHVPAEVAETVLDRFAAVHLVDDADFARTWVGNRQRTRALGRGALRRELAEKGVAADVIEEVLATTSDDDEEHRAEDLVRRKVTGSVDLADRAERDKYTRRWVAMLARKGYSPSLALSVVSRVIDESLADAD